MASGAQLLGFRSLLYHLLAVLLYLFARMKYEDIKEMIKLINPGVYKTF